MRSWTRRVRRRIEHLYDEGVAASSDHAPVVVDLDLTSETTPG
jgi:endonuclease/exonuclease/phosphatase family metal-dependent hydrolase